MPADAAPRWHRPLRAFLYGSALCVAMLAVATSAVRWELGRLCALVEGRMPGIERLLPGTIVRAASVAHGLHWLNPYVQFKGVALQTPQGTRGAATLVAGELDTLRSLLHLAPVLRHLEVRGGVADIGQAADGHWQLPRTRTVGEGFVGSAWWRTLLWQSGRLELADLRVRLRPVHGAPVGLRLMGAAQNGAGTHQLDARLMCTGECGGYLRYNLSGGRVGGLQEGSLAFRLLGVPRVAGALRVGGSWLDIGDNHGAGDFVIHRGTNAGSGSFLASARLHGPVGGVDAVLASRLAGGGEHDLDLRLTDLSLRLNDRLIPMAGAVLARRGENWFATLPDVQLQSVVAPIVAAGVLPGDATRWLQQLNPQARLHDLRVYVGERFAYSAAVDGVTVAAFGGSPMVRDLRGRVIGDANGGRLTILPGRMALGFPDVFDAAFDGISIAGPLDFHYGANGFALHSGLLNVAAGDVSVGGRFALRWPKDSSLRTLTLLLEATNGRAEATPRYLPKTLAPNLRNWLVQAIGVGRVPRGFVGLHTYLGPELAHHTAVELAFDVEHTAFRFLPEWPRLDDVVGQMKLSHGLLTAAVSGARSGGLRVATGQVSMRTSDPHLTVVVRGVANPAGATEFLLHSPLGRQLAWLGDWQGSGDFGFDLSGRFALNDAAHKFTVTARHAGTTLRNDRLHVTLTGLAGALRYEFPRNIAASGLRASLNQKPVTIDIRSTADDVLFSGRGRGDGAWLSQWLPWPLAKVTGGGFDYFATLRVHTGAELPRGEPGTLLDVRSDLVGFAVRLPAPFVKAAATARPLKFHLQASDDVLRLRVDDAQLAFRGLVRGGAFERGALGLGSLGVAALGGGTGVAAPPFPAAAQPLPPGPAALPAPGAPLPLASRAVLPPAIEAVQPFPTEALQAAAPGLRVTGNPEAVDVLGWSALLAGSTGGGGNMPLSVDLDIGRLLLIDQALPKAKLRVVTRPGGWRVDVDQQTLVANLQVFQDRRPMQLRIGRLRLPRSPEPAGAQPLLPAPGTPEAADPLLDWPIKQFPQMNVAIESLLYGSELLGKVKFDLQPTADGIELGGVTGTLRNVAFNGARLTWQRDARGDRTRMSGVLSAGDLAPVLESFGFAGSIRSQAVTFRTDFGWAGSPANYAARRLEGTAHVNVTNGRFVQVQGANAARVLGVFDFASIARRARLDFSDVFGKGLSFDSIDADLRFAGGELTFPNTLRVEGPGSAFRVGGSVNLASGALDNDMIVTLPLSRALPWYAAYALFTANPLAGAGVLVAERLLHDRLDRFSSAKYHVDGTIEEPQVKFVTVFSNELDQPRLRAPPAAKPAASTKPVLDERSSAAGPEPTMTAATVYSKAAPITAQTEPQP